MKFILISLILTKGSLLYHQPRPLDLSLDELCYDAVQVILLSQILKG